MERRRKKRGSLTRFPFQSGGIRVHNDRRSHSFASPGATYSAFIAQSRPVLRPFDRSISRRPARAVHRPTSLLSTEPIDHKSGIGVVVRLPLHRSVHPPSPLSLFSASENASLARLPQSCKYDGAPSVLSRRGGRGSRTRVNGAFGIDSPPPFLCPIDDRIEHSSDSIVANWTRNGLAFLSHIH